MVAKITFFPVGNGDMTLIEFESGRKVLVDVNIRAAADDADDDTPDVAQKLRDRLQRDSEGRLYIDAFLLSHPDKDHCSGLRNHFHLGAPAEWSKATDKIFIREIWSSPMVFRRASRDHVLCDDAAAFNSEARRRVRRFRDTGGGVSDGDRILILGEDQDGKTDDLTAILVKVDEVSIQRRLGSTSSAPRWARSIPRIVAVAAPAKRRRSWLSPAWALTSRALAAVSTVTAASSPRCSSASAARRRTVRSIGRITSASTGASTSATSASRPCHERPSPAPAIGAMKGMPQALTWNIGTMSKSRSRSHSEIELAVIEAKECSHIERCEYTTPLGFPVVPEV